MQWNVLDVPIHGTLTKPSGQEPGPGVILVAGSGPTNGDWCSPLLKGKNGSGRLLAEALTRRGFHTLRYDKLVSDPYVKENLSKFAGKISMQTHVEELKGAVETMLSERNVDKDNLFVLGNSEGTIHAVNYQLDANNNRFKGLVLTGAPGRPVGDVARTQLLEQLNFVHNAGGATGFMIKLVSAIKALPDTELTMKHYDEAVGDFVAGRPVHPDKSLPKGIQRLILSLTRPASQPFSRELWTYSLPKYLTQVTNPILVVIGKKDIQVDWKLDGSALEEATSQDRAISFTYPEKANHLLKHEEKPREKLNARYVGSHYNSNKAHLDEGAADAIFSWLGSVRHDAATESSPSA